MCRSTKWISNIVVARLLDCFTAAGGAQGIESTKLTTSSSTPWMERQWMRLNDDLLSFTCIALCCHTKHYDEWHIEVSKLFGGFYLRCQFPRFALLDWQLMTVPNWSTLCGTTKPNAKMWIICIECCLPKVEAATARQRQHDNQNQSTYIRIKCWKTIAWLAKRQRMISAICGTYWMCKVGHVFTCAIFFLFFFFFVMSTLFRFRCVFKNYSNVKC